jgi:hypothetical protein
MGKENSLSTTEILETMTKALSVVGIVIKSYNNLGLEVDGWTLCRVPRWGQILFNSHPEQLPLDPSLTCATLDLYILKELSAGESLHPSRKCHRVNVEFEMWLPVTRRLLWSVTCAESDAKSQPWPHVTRGQEFLLLGQILQGRWFWDDPSQTSPSY